VTATFSKIIPFCQRWIFVHLCSNLFILFLLIVLDILKQPCDLYWSLFFTNFRTNDSSIYFYFYILANDAPSSWRLITLSFCSIVSHLHFLMTESCAYFLLSLIFLKLEIKYYLLKNSLYYCESKINRQKKICDKDSFIC